jgi:hypothetical protein
MSNLSVTDQSMLSRQSNHSGSTRPPAVSKSVQEERDNEKWKKRVANWKSLIKTHKVKNFFMTQMIVCANQEKWGSTWQEIICRDLEVPEECSERFWEEGGGRAEARQVINDKRNNSSSAMKKVFMGKSG